MDSKGAIPYGLSSHNLIISHTWYEHEQRNATPADGLYGSETNKTLSKVEKAKNKNTVKRVEMNGDTIVELLFKMLCPNRRA